MTTYIYPQNLKAHANMWLWSLRDFAIICVALLISVLALTQTGILFPLAMTIGYGFLSIQMDGTTVLDYIGYAVGYFLTTQQQYEWRCD